MDADLICLQEVRAQNRKEAARFAHWPQAQQADFLAPAGYHAIYRSNAITKHGEHGNALLSRWPLGQQLVRAGGGAIAALGAWFLVRALS